MKGYEDVLAGILLLIVVLVGGYIYLVSEVNPDPNIANRHIIKHLPETFESRVKETD